MRTKKMKYNSLIVLFVNILTGLGCRESSIPELKGNDDIFIKNNTKDLFIKGTNFFYYELFTGENKIIGFWSIENNIINFIPEKYSKNCIVKYPIFDLEQ